MGYDDPPIRFRPAIRLLGQDALAPPEPLIREIQDEFAIRPDLPPVPPVAEAQEVIIAMFEQGAEEYARIKKLPTEYQTQFRRLTLRCRVQRCSLAVVYQRDLRAPRLICLHPKARVIARGDWQPMPPLAVPAENEGPDVTLKLRCRCQGAPNADTTTRVLMHMATADPGTHPVP